MAGLIQWDIPVSLKRKFQELTYNMYLVSSAQLYKHWPLMSNCLRRVGTTHDRAPSCLDSLPEGSQNDSSHNGAALAACEARKGKKSQVLA